VLYESLCARPPFSGDTPAATALARLHQLPPRPRQIRATVPRGLDAVVMRCLQLDREDRYANALELRAALLEQSTLHEPDDLTVATAVDPTSTWAHQPTAAAGAHGGGAPSTNGSGAPGAVTLVEPQARWVRPTLAVVFVVLALALAGILIGGTSTGRQLFSWAEKSTSSSTIDGSSGADTDPTNLRIQSVASFDPGGAGTPGENDGQLQLAVDGDATTSWHTESYNQRRFGTKPGVGIVVTLAASTDLRRLDVASPTQGWAASVYVTPSAASLPTSLDGWGQPVDQQTGINGDATFDLGNTSGQAVLLWITDLGDAPPRVRAEIDEISVTG